MTTNYFNVKTGITVGANVAGKIVLDGANGNISTTNANISGNLIVSGTSNLSAAGNVTITGGSSGQVLTWNTGNTLQWASPATGSSIANGTSNVSIPVSNGNVNTSVGGTANVLVVTSTGANVTGTVNVSGTSLLVGSVGVGSALGTATNLYVNAQLTGATTAVGIQSSGGIQSGVTTLASYFTTSASTAAASFTLPSLYHYNTSQGTIGSGSTVTAQYGFNAAATLTGATTNYGFYGALASSGSAVWNLYMAGSAPNYLAGQLAIGSATLTNGYASVAPTQSATAAQFYVGGTNTNAGASLYGAYLNPTITGTATSFTAYGMFSQPVFSFSAGATVAQAISFNNVTTLVGTVTPTTLIGIQGTTQLNASATGGTITYATAIQADSIYISASATTNITYAYGFYAANITKGAAQTVGTAFAFYGNQGTGSATNSWNLYMAGAAPNYLNGSLYLGGTTAASAILTGRSAANLTLGLADAAAPVAQTLSVQNVVAGTTDTAGTNFTITGSRGTGTGAGGSIIFQTAAASTTGSTQNALSTALTIASTRAVTISAPSSGIALTATGVASSYTAKIIGSSTSGSSLGLLINAGTTAADYALVVQNATASSTNLIINGVGNFGISQTPSAWGSGYTAIQIGPSLSLWTGGSGAALSSNLYYDGALRKYITSAFALEYQQNISSGSHIWYVAPSGTAGGTVSLTTAMSINSSGTVTIASAGSSPSLVVNGTSTNADLQYTDGTHTVYLGYTSGATAYIGTQTSANLGLITGNTNRLSISSVGAVTIAAPSSGNTLGISQFAGSSQLALNGSTSGTVSIQTAAAAGTWTLQLPAAVPASNNSVLVSTTAGVSSWLASTGSAGSNVLSTAPTLTGQVTVNASAAATKAILINGAASGSAAIAMAQNSGTGSLYWISAGTNGYLNIGGNGTSEPATGAIAITSTGSVSIAAPSGNPSLTIGQFAGSAQLALSGSTSGTVGIQTAAAAGTWTLTLPTTAGTSGYVLQTDGTGITSWTNTIATATTATNATNSAITNNAGVSSATWYPTFVSAGTGNLPITVDSTSNILSYVPSTGTLTATILNATSDARLKKNIAKIENPLDIISKLNGVRYQWINNDNLSAGLIAQEVEAVMPELVTETTDGMKGINYNGVIGVLVESVKQLNSELTALRAEVAELKRV